MLFCQPCQRGRCCVANLVRGVDVVLPTLSEGSMLNVKNGRVVKSVCVCTTIAVPECMYVCAHTLVLASLELQEKGSVRQDKASVCLR